MKVLSLFDGMSCGMIAFRQAGIPVEEYHAYETDKYAVATSKYNFPEIVHHGDVFDGNFTEYNGCDWLIGGSPCTYWSIAQNPEKRETVASGIGWDLFQQYVRALHEAEPEYFLYENNFSMSDSIRESISETFGFEPIMINSALVSAQNRKRLYWVGKRNEGGTYSKCRIGKPKDREIVLQDILCTGFALNTIGQKSLTLKAQYAKNGVTNFMRCNSTYGATGVAEPVRTMNFDIDTVPNRENGCLAILDMPKTHEQIRRVYDTKGKSPTLTAHGGGNTEPKVFTDISKVRTKGQPRFAYQVENGEIAYRGKKSAINLDDGLYVIRKLTVSECKRLQTVPDWYEFPVSDTQAYKMLGNGWTVDVIRHLIESALTGKTEESYIQFAFA